MNPDDKNPDGMNPDDKNLDGKNPDDKNPDGFLVLRNHSRRMKGQGQRQLGPWPGPGGSDGLHHATRHDMKLLNLTFMPCWKNTPRS